MIEIVTSHLHAYEKCGYLSEVFCAVRWMANGIVMSVYAMNGMAMAILISHSVPLPNLAFGEV